MAAPVAEPLKSLASEFAYLTEVPRSLFEKNAATCSDDQSKMIYMNVFDLSPLFVLYV